MLVEFGIPCYLKIDIEESVIFCVFKTSTRELAAIHLN